jgi:hypothetical protein
MEEVEMKGKKQMMFLGLPTYEGALRFADVSHLQPVRRRRPTDGALDCGWSDVAPFLCCK